MTCVKIMTVTVGRPNGSILNMLHISPSGARSQRKELQTFALASIPSGEHLQEWK